MIQAFIFKQQHMLDRVYGYVLEICRDVAIGFDVDTIWWFIYLSWKQMYILFFLNIHIYTHVHILIDVDRHKRSTMCVATYHLLPISNTTISVQQVGAPWEEAVESVWGCQALPQGAAFVKKSMENSDLEPKK